jgi:acylphosphatase
MAKDIVQKHIFISGRVQGVGFRAFTRKEASTRGIRGWVKNLADGRVEIKIEGEREKIKDMIRRIKEGPSFARVDDIEVIDEEIENFDRFEVRF